MKKIFLLVAIISSLIFATSACTSKKVEDQPDATADMTGEATEDMADVAEGGEAPSGEFNEDDFGSSDVAETPAEGSESTDGAVADSGEAPTDDSASADSANSSDMEGLAANDSSADPGTAPESTDTSSDTSSDTSMDTASNEAPVDTSSELADSGTSLPSDEMGGLTEEAPAPKAMIPLRKIETAPWTQAGVLVNAVYLARQGDNFNKVSEKIYGNRDKVGELKKVNPSIAARSMKVGDKVYYNSPRRPTDNTALMVYYEDNNLAPETYVSQPGENIREVSNRLLGDTNSWKEVWATNMDVESKGELPEGTRLRYWAGDVAAPPPAVEQPIAQNPPPAEMPQDPNQGQMAQGNVAPPPADMGNPPPPMPEDVSQANAGAPPPPMEELPPEPTVAEAPPPPAPVDAGMEAGAAASPLGDLLGGQDQTTALMIGALLLIAAAALFIIIRKRKSRKNIDFQTATHTQIE